MGIARFCFKVVSLTTQISRKAEGFWAQPVCLDLGNEDFPQKKVGKSMAFSCFLYRLGPKKFQYVTSRYVITFFISKVCYLDLNSVLK